MPENLVAIRMRGTPVPIPNTTVKTHAADGTSLETVRESRWPPESKRKKCPVTAQRPCTHLENRIYESCSNMLKGRTEAVGTVEGKPGSMHTKNRKTIRGVTER